MSKPGRPTLYQPEYAQQAYKLALLGMDDAEMAAFFEVSERTLYQWKQKHPEFAQSILNGGEIADAEVAASLYKSAVGGAVVRETKTVVDESGKSSVTTVEAEAPGDTQAARWWLKNRRAKGWKDKVEIREDINVNVFPPKEVLDGIYNRVLAEAAKRDAMLVGRRERLGIVATRSDEE